MKLSFPASVEARKLQIRELVTARMPEPLRGAVMAVVEAAPDEFWTAPASFGGKHHREDEREEGGLYRHTLRCVQWADEFARFYPVEAPALQMAVFIGALCHDMWKGHDGRVWVGKTVPYHGELAARKIGEICGALKLTEGERLVIRLACEAVHGHMTQWSQPPVAFSSLPTVAAVVAMADYASSRTGTEVFV